MKTDQGTSSKNNSQAASVGSGMGYQSNYQGQNSVIPAGFSVPEGHGSAVSSTSIGNEQSTTSPKGSGLDFMKVMRVEEITKYKGFDPNIPEDSRVVAVSFGPYDSDNRMYYTVPKLVAERFEVHEKISTDELLFLDDAKLAVGRSIGFRSGYYPTDLSGLGDSLNPDDDSGQLNKGGGEVYGPPAPPTNKGLRGVRSDDLVSNTPSLEKIHNNNKDQSTGLSAGQVIYSDDPVKTVALAKKAALDRYNAEIAANGASEITPPPPPALTAEEQWSIMDYNQRKYVEGVVAAKQAAAQPLQVTGYNELGQAVFNRTPTIEEQAFMHAVAENKKAEEAWYEGVRRQEEIDRYVASLGSKPVEANQPDNDKGPVYNPYLDNNPQSESFFWNL